MAVPAMPEALGVKEPQLRNAFSPRAPSFAPPRLGFILSRPHSRPHVPASNSALRTVLLNRIATVIGPTPPGTGVR